MVLAGKYHRYAYNGNEQTWILNDKGKLGFRFVRYERVFMDKLSDLDLKALFEENDKQLFINDVLLDPAYYDYREGSLIIDLKDSYLNSLSVGRYNLTVKFADGEVSAAFNVKERAKPSTDSYVMPKTGS